MTLETWLLMAIRTSTLGIVASLASDGRHGVKHRNPQ